VDEKELFLKFWEREARATRKVISRIPEDKSDYKPEPKSRTALEIAWLIVMEEKVLAEGLENGRKSSGSYTESMKSRAGPDITLDGSSYSIQCITAGSSRLI